jgi:hypothetical protein
MAVARSARRWLPDPDAWRRLFLDPEARRQFPNSEERWRWLPDPEGERCQGPGAGERQRHSLGKRASGNIAPEAGRRRCRTPRPERRRHTITHERRCAPPPPPRRGRGPPSARAPATPPTPPPTVSPPPPDMRVATAPTRGRIEWRPRTAQGARGDGTT